MIVAVEEIIVGSKGVAPYFNFSPKSYMMTYCQQVSATEFIFQDGTFWRQRGDYGPTFIKQRGFVTGAFTPQV